MTDQTSKSGSVCLAPIQRGCYFAVMLLSWCGLIWVGMQVSAYFSGFAVLFGVVILFLYLLLAPVNTIHRLLKKPATFLVENYLLAKDGQAKVRWLSLTPAAVSHMTRAFAIFIVYLVFFLFLTVLSIRFLPLAVSQFSGFLNGLPQYASEIEEWLTEQPWVEPLVGSMDSLSGDSVVSTEQVTFSGRSLKSLKSSSYRKQQSKDKIRTNLEQATQKVQTYLATHLNTGFSSLWGFLSSTVSSIVYLLAGLVLLFYLLLDGERLREGFLAVLPSEQRETADFIMLNFHRLMFAFVKSQLMLGLVTGAFMVIVYSMFGVPYALFLGAFFAIAEIIPVVGTWIGFTPGIMVLLFMSPVKLIAVMAICYIYQTIKDNIVAPKVVGDALGVHPVIVIVSILLCSQVAGLLGVVFAIPLASLVNVLLEYSKTKACAQSA